MFAFSFFIYFVNKYVLNKKIINKTTLFKYTGCWTIEQFTNELNKEPIECISPWLVRCMLCEIFCF